MSVKSSSFNYWNYLKIRNNIKWLCGVKATALKFDIFKSNWHLWTEKEKNKGDAESENKVALTISMFLSVMLKKYNLLFS